MMFAGEELRDEARRSWVGFSSEWDEFRDLAEEHGILYAPAGTDMDSWSDDHPSQRAILIRAIRDTPKLLMRCIEWPGSRSWAGVIERLLMEWREKGMDIARGDEWEQKRREDPTREEATESLRAIMDRWR